MITVSAPGKIHLMGEHAVVYGKPAMLAAINKRVRVTIAPGKELEIHAPDDAAYISQVVALVCRQYGVTHPPHLSIHVHSDVAAGYHVGSSAAVAVATIGALVYALKSLWNPTAINQLAFEAEKIKHGNPSGADNTTVTFGGFIWFRKELDFLRSVWQLPMRLPKTLNHFWLVDTGKPVETTGEMVAMVKEEVKRKKKKMEQLFTQNEQQTKRVASALKEGSQVDLIDAMRKGQRTLEGMGVVSDIVITLIRDIEAAGGAAKILGGGGKKEGVGYLLCYHPDAARVRQLSASYHYAVEPILLGEEGVRLDEK